MEQWDIEVDFEFQAARRLPRLPDSHPCSRLHGHTFRCSLVVSGGLDPALEWVADFGELEAVVTALRAALEHRFLNEIPGLDNPTSEVLARWIWRRAAPALPGLSAVRVGESSTTRCVYRGTP